MITKPTMPIDQYSEIAPVISTAMPPTKTTPAAIARRWAAAAQRGAAQGGGELGVLLDEGALHLLEQSELLFGERHRSSTWLSRASDVLALAVRQV